MLGQLQELEALEVAVLGLEVVLALMALQTQAVAVAVLDMLLRLMAVMAALVS